MSEFAGTKKVGRSSTAGNKITISKVVIYMILILWTLICIFPVYWMLTFSLKDNTEIFGANVIGMPTKWLWSNYTEAMNTGHMEVYFLNSFIIAVVTILITLVASAMATYAMTRLVWKGRESDSRGNCSFVRCAGTGWSAEYTCGADYSVFGVLVSHGHPDLYRLHGGYSL